MTLCARGSSLEKSKILRRKDDPLDLIIEIKTTLVQVRRVELESTF